MSVTYNDLIEAVIKREFGILGKERMMGILVDTDMGLDDADKLQKPDCSIEDLDRLMQALAGKYGAVAVMGCKITVGRMAREKGLELPPILR